ncbi:hypothetical protein CspeluHIS016_0301210 [Cutaneotrichosporon spelunceum]|uniref:Uncharacterized protein n=1 Tax=Cutaneotrichosporon spelunceum TaxID=1672016 RepID=A0AAD3TTM5_9TREE|nr:hypothetical protein CspeluHIS016_0301210 [Cutaneotrichosporon spelunceum]
MRVLALFLLATAALAVPGQPQSSTATGCSTSLKPPSSKTPKPPKSSKTPKPPKSSNTSPTSSNTPTPTGSAGTCPPTPLPAPPPTTPTLQNTWGRGSIDPASFIEGSYINGSEYLSWAWALIYRPADGGTFCLTTYSPEAPAAMVAYVADTFDPASAAMVAGTAGHVGAACVSGVDASCVDFYAQWGNASVIARGAHCFACGNADHGPGA